MLGFHKHATQTNRQTMDTLKLKLQIIMFKIEKSKVDNSFSPSHQLFKLLKATGISQIWTQLFERLLNF